MVIKVTKYTILYLKSNHEAESVAKQFVLRSIARGGYSPPPHWPADQNAELGKYHVFSTFKTFFCPGLD